MGRGRFTKLDDSNLCHKVAVKSHNPELCSFLIEAGADKDVRTLYVAVPQRLVADMMESDAFY